MPDSSYFFTSGEPVDVGSHGDHAYFYHSGEPVTDRGKSDYFFETGTGVGSAVPPPVAHYKFNGDLTDASGNGNHLTGHGSGYEFVSGRDGQALRSFYNNEDTYLTTGAILSGAVNWSYAGWIWWDQTGEQVFEFSPGTEHFDTKEVRGEFGEYDTNSNDYNHTNTVDSDASPNVQYTVGPLSLSSSWTFLAVVNDGDNGTLTLYRGDATTVSTASFTAGHYFQALDNGLTMLWDPGDLGQGEDHQFEGRLDDWQFWDVALSSAQVSDLYNSYP